MCNPVGKILNVMSLEDKVRIIRTFDKLETLEEKFKFVGRHNVVAHIIKNKDKILAQQMLIKTKVEAVKKGFSQHKNMRDDFVKVSFLESAIFEWYQRYRNTVSTRDITFGCFRERIEIAREMLNIKLFILTDPWVMNLRLTCNKGKPKDINKEWSMNLKDIIRYVLAKEGISKETAQYKYGIYLDGIEEESFTIKDEERSLGTCNLEQSEFIDVDNHVYESSEARGDVDASSTLKLEFELEDYEDCVGDGGTSFKSSLEDNQLLNQTNNPILSEHNSIDVCELVEVYQVQDDNDSTSVEKNINATGEFLEDNKDALKYLNLDTEPATLTKDSVDDYDFLKTNQDALLHLNPLREYLMSEDNVIALELLTQMEATLIKSEKN